MSKQAFVSVWARSLCSPVFAHLILETYRWRWRSRGTIRRTRIRLLRLFFRIHLIRLFCRRILRLSRRFTSGSDLLPHWCRLLSFYFFGGQQFVLARVIRVCRAVFIFTRLRTLRLHHSPWWELSLAILAIRAILLICCVFVLFFELAIFLARAVEFIYCRIREVVLRRSIVRVRFVKILLRIVIRSNFIRARLIRG